MKKKRIKTYQIFLFSRANFNFFQFVDSLIHLIREVLTSRGYHEDNPKLSQECQQRTQRKKIISHVNVCVSIIKSSKFTLKYIVRIKLTSKSRKSVRNKRSVNKKIENTFLNSAIFLHKQSHFSKILFWNSEISKNKNKSPLSVSKLMKNKISQNIKKALKVDEKMIRNKNTYIPLGLIKTHDV